MPRDSSLVLQRRNERARAEGWTSYGQKRYWLIFFDRDQAGTAKRLANQICGHNNREGSYMCTECNERVNPRTETRSGDWRARLVNARILPSQVSDRR